MGCDFILGVKPRLIMRPSNRFWCSEGINQVQGLTVPLSWGQKEREVRDETTGQFQGVHPGDKDRALLWQGLEALSWAEMESWTVGKMRRAPRTCAGAIRVRNAFRAMAFGSFQHEQSFFRCLKKECNKETKMVLVREKGGSLISTSWNWANCKTPDTKIYNYLYCKICSVCTTKMF